MNSTERRLPISLPTVAEPLLVDEDVLDTTGGNPMPDLASNLQE